jgi:hypothetical protein
MTMLEISDSRSPVGIPLQGKDGAMLGRNEGCVDGVEDGVEDGTENTDGVMEGTGDGTAEGTSDGNASNWPDDAGFDVAALGRLLG